MVAVTANKKPGSGKEGGRAGSAKGRQGSAGAKTGNAGRGGGADSRGKNAAKGGRNAAPAVEEAEDFMGAEVLIILSFAIAVLLFLSNFNLCGAAGRYLRAFQLGIFGSVGFVAPFLLFAGTCFYLSNQGNVTAMRKLLACVAAVLVLCGFAQLLFGKSPAEGSSVWEYYRLSSESGIGGGLTGGIICGVLTSVLGNIGAFLVLTVCFAISAVCITERSLVKAVKRQGDAAYRYAREDFDRRREEHEKRQEERRIQKEQRVRGVNLESTDLAAQGDYYEEYDGYGMNPEYPAALAEEYEDHRTEDAVYEEGAVQEYQSAQKDLSAGVGRAEPSQREDQPDERKGSKREDQQGKNKGERQEQQEQTVDPADVFVGKIMMPARYEGEDTAPFEVDKVLSPAESAQLLVAEGISRLSDFEGSFGRPVKPPAFHTPASEPSFHGLSEMLDGDSKAGEHLKDRDRQDRDLRAAGSGYLPQEEPAGRMVHIKEEPENEIFMGEDPADRRGNQQGARPVEAYQPEPYPGERDNRRIPDLQRAEIELPEEGIDVQERSIGQRGEPDRQPIRLGWQEKRPGREDDSDYQVARRWNEEESGNEDTSGRQAVSRWNGEALEWEAESDEQGWQEEAFDQADEPDRQAVSRWSEEGTRQEEASGRQSVRPGLQEDRFRQEGESNRQTERKGWDEEDSGWQEAGRTSSGEFLIPEEAKRVVTASGKVIESDTEALQKRLESKRREALADRGAGEISVQQQIREKEILPKKEYVFPPVTLLKRGNLLAGANSQQEYKDTAIKLQQTLRDFGVGVTVTNISCGPSVTRYELHPEQGVKVSRIVGLADDIKLSLAAADIRIEAPIPGKSAVGIEVPNKENTTVYLRELLESEAFQEHPSQMAFAVGKDIGGQVVVTDIAKMPHLLIAGATGSGKSVCINTLIMSILFKASPDEVKLIMVDPKVVELSVYNGIPHLLIPVVTDPKKASGALNWAVAEMQDRYKKFAECNVRNLKGYNSRIEKLGDDVPEEEKPKKLPQIVIIVDELADLMMVAPGEVEDAICRLAQLARAAGIHLVIATQRPSVNVITGLIKANVPSRIAFSVSSGVDSRTIIDMHGAEKLLGKGDMLFFPSGIPKPQRVQGAFVSDSEVQKIVEFLSEQGLTASYDPSVEKQMSSAAAMSGGSGGAGGRDEYFEQAGRFIIEKDKASIGMLQRMFKIGFNRAARIMDQLADAGVVGEDEGTKPRKILVTMEEFEELL